MEENKPATSSQSKNVVIEFIKASFIEIIIIGVVVGGLIAALNYFNVISLPNILSRNTLPPTTVNNTSPQTAGDNNVETTSAIEVPIDINDPSVDAAQVHYNIKGTIKELKPYDNNYTQIVLKESGPNMPPLAINEQTEVVRIIGVSPTVESADTEPAHLSDLKPNDLVRLTVTYTPRYKMLVIQRVRKIIYPSITPQPRN